MLCLKEGVKLKLLFLILPDCDRDRYLFGKRTRNVDTFLPLGIAQLAAVLEKEGHTNKVIDLRLENLKLEELSSRIKNYQPAIINISSYFCSIENIKKYSRYMKKSFNIPIVIGGPHPVLYPVTIYDTDSPLKPFLHEKTIDFFIVGEGEVVFPVLLKNLKKNSFKNIKGLYYRQKNGKLIKNSGRPLTKNLDILPFPAFHLFNLKKYIPLAKHYKRTPVVPMSTSRGCTWGKCSFCWQSRLKGYYRKQSPKRVVDEIKYAVKKYGAREIRFWDDTFFHRKDWIHEFCDLLEEENLNIIWSCHERLNMISEEIVNRIAKSGCWQILFGIESGNSELLKKVNKGTTLELARKAITLTKKAGIETRASFILGLPDETPKMTDETIEFAKKLNADITQFSLLTPYPGTKMYDEIKYSTRLNKNLDNYSEFRVVYLPSGYKNTRELEQKYKRAYRDIYFNINYLIRSLMRIRSWDDVRRHYDGFKTVLGLSLAKRITK